MHAYARRQTLAWCCCTCAKVEESANGHKLVLRNISENMTIHIPQGVISHIEGRGGGVAGVNWEYEGGRTGLGLQHARAQPYASYTV